VVLQVSVHMVTDEGIDWWSKYYASAGMMDKCKHYLELGYDKIQACCCYVNLYWLWGWQHTDTRTVRNRNFFIANICILII